MMGKLERDIWRMADGSWGAETKRNGVGVAVRRVGLARAVWHVLTVRRPDEYGEFIDLTVDQRREQEHAMTPVWCARCNLWVPAEKEPHIGHSDDAPHYARDYAQPAATARREARG